MRAWDLTVHCVVSANCQQSFEFNITRAWQHLTFLEEDGTPPWAWAPVASSERRRRVLSTWWDWAAAELGTAGEERTQQDSSVRSVRQRGSETKIIKLSVGDVCPRGHHAAIEFSSGKTLITAVTTGDQLTLRPKWECCREYLRSCCVNKTASKSQQVKNLKIATLWQLQFICEQLFPAFDFIIVSQSESGLAHLAICKMLLASHFCHRWSLVQVSS